MKTTFKKFAAALGLVLIGTILTAKASAECLSYLPGPQGGRRRLATIMERGDVPARVASHDFQPRFRRCLDRRVLESDVHCHGQY
jgi:hypothetical protein